MAAAGEQPPPLREHDRAPPRELPGKRVRVVVARHEHEGAPDARDLRGEGGLERYAAGRQVPGEEQRLLARGTFERRQRKQVVVEVGCEREARQRVRAEPLARDRDQPRQVEQLIVEVLPDRLRGLGRVLRDLQSDGDLGPVRVVVGVLDRLARGQQQGDGGRDRARSRRRTPARCAAVPAGAAQGECDQRPDRERGARDEEHEPADVGLDRVARLACASDPRRPARSPHARSRGCRPSAPRSSAAPAAAPRRSARPSRPAGRRCRARPRAPGRRTGGPCRSRGRGPTGRSLSPASAPAAPRTRRRSAATRGRCGGAVREDASWTVYPPARTAGRPGNPTPAEAAETRSRRSRGAQITPV